MAVLTDTELLREALKALKEIAPDRHRVYLHHRAFQACDFPECEDSRTVAIKLEERLLQE